MRNICIVASLAALIAVLFNPAPLAQAQATHGAGRGPPKYVCKSGQNVRNPKACKENGGFK
jgi:uncharacterized membrane protein